MDGTRVEGGSEEAAATVTVHGTVIDYWRQPVPDVDVYLGSATTKSDAMGKFSFGNVTPPYDIGLAVRRGVPQFGGSENAWLFKNLRRADPTLQVKDGSFRKVTNTGWKFQNVPRPSDAGAVHRFTGISFGSPETSWSDTFTDTDGTDLGPSSFDFATSNSSTGTAHALLWEQTNFFNTRFLAIDQKALSLEAGVAKNVTFDMTADALPSQEVSGTVMPSIAGPIRVDAYVRFDDGSAIRFFEQELDSTPFFQTFVPLMSGATITVSAVVGSPPYESYALAHMDGVGQGAVFLPIPQPISQVVPAGRATNLGPAGPFAWMTGQRVALLVISCPGPQSDEGPTQFYVVTEDDHASLATLPGTAGIPWPKGRLCQWWIETHGSYPTVDDATGPTGFLDPYSLESDARLRGPKRDNGSFTTSEPRAFTTSP